jgi:hypothetical protein
MKNYHGIIADHKAKGEIDHGIFRGGQLIDEAVRQDPAGLFRYS